VKVLNNFIIIILLFLNVSCGQVSYITEQSIGQLKIQWKGMSPEEAKKSGKMTASQEQKLKLVLKAKDFFYKYMSIEMGSIYSEVVFLDQEAVTYLVVASPYDKVEALKVSVPFLGSFPYLGFFKYNSAKDYASKLDKQSYFTHLRPVYAYSTLGHFEDKILSSFFYLSDLDLVETIYHELFHTIFFVKNEVDFNENLATYFAKKMMLVSPFLSAKDVEDKLLRDEKQDAVTQRFVELAKEYAALVLVQKPKNKIEAQKNLDQFILDVLNPEIYKICGMKSLSGKDCPFFARKWNHAALAAILTYEQDQFFWDQWWRSLHDRGQPANPKVLYQFLSKNLANYQDSDENVKSFEEYLKKKILK